MPSIYNDSGEEFNKRCFKLIVPNWYNPVMPKYFKSGEAAPIYNEDLHAKGLTAMPCTLIVDMLFQEVPFTVMEEKDNKIIYDIISAYMDDAKTYQHMDKKLNELMTRCQLALDKIGHELKGIDKRDAKPKSFNMLNILEQIGLVNRKVQQ